MNFKKILAGMSAMAIASTMAMAAFADVVETPDTPTTITSEEPTTKTVFEGSTTFDAAWALADGDYIKISPTALGTLSAGDKVTVTAAPLDDTAASQVTIQNGAWGDITGVNASEVTADKTEYDFVLDDAIISEINENIGDEGETALVVKGGNVVITKVTVTTAAGTTETPETPAITVDTSKAIMVLKGKDGEEKTSLGWESNQIDTTSLTAAEKASVRKITVDYVTDTTWINGKIQVNVADSSTKKGYKNQGNSGGSCFAWDLDEDGNPQLWGNSAEGITFDTKTGKGTAEWTLPNLAAEGEADRYEGIFFAEDDEFDPEEGDATGLNIQLGDMNNIKNADDTYTGATFAINAITLYDANGEVIKKIAHTPVVTPVEPKITVDTKDAIKVISGKDGEEKTDSWADNFIDLTKYDVSKIDKVKVNYQTDSTWTNGKLAGNVKADTAKGYKFAAAPGACLSWDLDADGNPQLWGNSNEGVTFDVETGNGSIEWSGLQAAGGLYSEEGAVFDPETGDPTGLDFQVGTMNNVVTSVDSDGNKTFKGATFAIKSIQVFDAEGNELKAAEEPKAPIVVDTKNAIAVVKGKDGEEKTDNWDKNNYVDLTKYDVSKIDKVVVEYQTDSTWSNGKLGANIIDASSKKGYKFTGAPGSCLAWDLDEKGDPQLWGNSNEGITFDVETGKGSISWTGLTGKLYQDPDVEFDPEDEGDSTGLTLQVGTMNNLVTGVDAEGNKTYKAATFAIQGIKFYDKNGKEVKPTTPTPVTPPVTVKAPGKIAKVTSAVTTNAVTLSWTKASDAKGYEVYRYDTAKKKYVLVATTAATKLTIKNLKSGTKYNFAVKPYNLNGKTKVYGAIVKASATTSKPVVKVATPSKVSKAVVKATTTSTAKISWTKAKNAKGYIVYKQVGKKFVRVAKTSGTSITFKKLKSGTKYTFAVKPYNQVGSKVAYASAATKVAAVTKIAPVTKLSVKNTAKGKATISFKKSSTSGVTYKVYVKSSKNGKSTLVASTKTNKVAKTKLKKNKTYYFTVKAVKKIGSKTYASSTVTKSVKIKK